MNKNPPLDMNPDNWTVNDMGWQIGNVPMKPTPLADCNDEECEQLTKEFAAATRQYHAVEFKDFDGHEYKNAVDHYTLAEYNLNRWRERNKLHTMESL